MATGLFLLVSRMLNLKMHTCDKNKHLCHSVIVWISTYRTFKIINEASLELIDLCIN